MRIIRHKIDISSIPYPLEQLAPIDDILFFDIETTGFTARSSSIYLIGCIYHTENGFELIQWFAEKYTDEKEVIESFFHFSEKYTHIIHFNGNNFDIPFIQQKCQSYQLPYRFDHLTGIDLYKRIAPYKFFLKIPNCKQKTVELFLGINRTDTFGGGDLINIYHSYVANPDESQLKVLLLHNADDILGLVRILPALSYYDLFNKPLKAKKVQANTYTDYYGTEHQELLIRVSLPDPLPVPVKFHANSCYFHGEDKFGTFRVPIYQEELKYFYSNYKDYYYLPDDDMAIHKSVAAYVDKNYKMKATAQNCYTRKYSCYLPEWDLLVQPFFKRDYKSKELFFELTEDIKTNRDLFSRYAEHILQMLANSY